MSKNFLIKIMAITCLIGQAFSSDQDQEKPIYTHMTLGSKVDVELLSSGNIVITPNTQGNFLNVRFDGSGSLLDHLSITTSNEKISVPLHNFRMNGKNVISGNIDGDLVNYSDSFRCNGTRHSMHNAGFYHSSDQQVYDNSIFSFKNKSAAVTLTPASKLLTEAKKVIASYPVENQDVFNVFATLLGSHLSPGRAAEAHPGTVKPGCCISSIKVSPLGDASIDLPINGYVSFLELFSINMTLQGGVLEFKPNTDYKFVILSD